MSATPNATRRMDTLLYILIIACVAYAIVAPMGLPIPISKETRALYDFVESLPPGRSVYIGYDYQASSLAEIEPSAIALARHCFRKGLKIVGAGITTESGSLMERAMSVVKQDYPDLVYGTDWVNIGYKGGGNVFFEAMGANIVNAASGVDFHGNRLEDMPLMREVNSLKDVALAASMGSLNEGLSTYVKMIGTPLGIPVTGACFAVSIPESMPLVQSGQLTGMLAGMKGAAEYEQLIQKPGAASVGMDAQSLTHVLVILFIIAGNIQYAASKRKAER